PQPPTVFPSTTLFRSRAPDTNPHTPVQVFGLTSGRLDLHVLADLISKEVSVVSHEDDCLDPVVAKITHAAPQMAQHAIHLEPGLDRKSTRLNSSHDQI